MENSVVAVMARTAECAALVFIGYSMRSAQLFSTTDAEAAQRLAGYLTVPAVLLQSCTTVPPVPWQALLGAPVLAAAAAAAAAFAWVRFKQRHKRERALLCGACVGADAPSAALPVIEALAGPVGLVAACSAVVANTLAVFIGSYLLTATAGPAFPETYKHDDGGSYRGEWRGLSKEGLGVYTYQSGARYEGEWRNNVKDGRGVYYFPKGGTYEGEWASGSMTGTGLRTYSTGKVTAGRWENGKLLTPLEVWQCATAAEGAAEAALAARRVVVGGGKPMDAVQQLIVQPVLWVAPLGLVLNAFAMPLPSSIAVVTAALAPANKALMLLSTGMLLQPQLPQLRQVSDVTTVAATRVATALFFTANALMLLPGCTHPIGRLSILAAAVILICPIAAATSEFTSRNFRLNESLSKACRDASLIASAPLLLLLALGVGALGLVPVQLPGAAAAVEVAVWNSAAAAAAAVDVSGGVTMLATVMTLLAAAVTITAGYVADRYAPDKKVAMRYAGTGTAAAAAAAESGSSSSSSGGGAPGGGPQPPVRALPGSSSKYSKTSSSSSSSSSSSGCRGAGGQQQQQQLYRRSWVPRQCSNSSNPRSYRCYAAPAACTAFVAELPLQQQLQQHQGGSSSSSSATSSYSRCIRNKPRCYSMAVPQQQQQQQRHVLHAVAVPTAGRRGFFVKV